MANYSICGIDCDLCKFKKEQNCKGCKTIKGNVFWGECDLYKCNSQKKIKNIAENALNFLVTH